MPPFGGVACPPAFCERLEVVGVVKEGVIWRMCCIEVVDLRVDWRWIALLHRILEEVRQFSGHLAGDSRV